MDRELSLEELETEHATELPERETLNVFGPNISFIGAFNGAVAGNAFTVGSLAVAVAVQNIGVGQG